MHPGYLATRIPLQLNGQCACHVTLECGVQSPFEPSVPCNSYLKMLSSLILSGTTKGNKATVSSPFVGCLRNVKLGGRPIEFGEKSQVFGAVSINSCPAD